MSLILFCNIGISSDPAGRSESARAGLRYIGISGDSAGCVHVDVQGFAVQY